MHRPCGRLEIAASSRALASSKSCVLASSWASDLTSWSNCRARARSRKAAQHTTSSVPAPITAMRRFQVAVTEASDSATLTTSG